MKKEEVESLYDGLAERYDLSETFLGHSADKMIELIEPQKGWRVLDVATGTGLVARRLSPLVGESGWVCGIDLSGGLIDQGRKRLGALGLMNVELLKMDAEAMIFADESFDCATCHMGLHWFPEPGKALAGIVRVLKHGGKLVVSAPGGSGRGGYLFATVIRKHGLSTHYRKNRSMDELFTESGIREISTVVFDRNVCYGSAEERAVRLEAGGVKASMLRELPDQWKEVVWREVNEEVDRICKTEGTMKDTTRTIFVLGKR